MSRTGSTVAGWLVRERGDYADHDGGGGVRVGGNGDVIVGIETQRGDAVQRETLTVPAPVIRELLARFDARRRVLPADADPQAMNIGAPRPRSKVIVTLELDIAADQSDALEAVQAVLRVGALQEAVDKHLGRTAVTDARANFETEGL